MPYTVINMAFVVFSPICPHLGCSVEWKASEGHFLCPCHGSEFTLHGERIAGPSPRGLDPLPLREASGTAEVTWIRYKGADPDRILVDYT